MPAAARAEAAPRLLAALVGGGAISGSDLATRLGVSRTAVWKQIERLRELGLPIAAQAGRGYRLQAPLDRLDAAQITALLASAPRSRLGSLDVRWQLDSTSSELLRRAAADPRDLLVCLAEVQTAGRGRRGRSWRMPLTGGIALSVLKRFDAGMAPLAGLSLVVGIAVAQALDDCGIGGIGLKWPNDIVAADHKLGGILVELGGDAIGPCHAVIGIGLNVRIDAATDAAIGQPCTDLARLAGAAAPARNLVVAHLLTRLIAALDRFSAQGFGAFVDEFAQRDVLRDRQVQVLRGDAALQGIARGVDARGGLRVAFADGERSIDSGEVSVRPQP
ncbi:MAG: biotin--[acetyl-CoA-carboxylase] ligase [Dokdonella sp.]